MPAITLEMTEYAYSQSVSVYLGKQTRLEAVEKIVSESGMNEGSAKDYVVGVGKILIGDLYKRTFNTEATNCILTKIAEQFDSSIYENALTSVALHLEYYENLRHGRLNSIRTILEKHKAAIKHHSEHIFPDDINETSGLTEGAIKRTLVNAYERNSVARNKCIEHHGAICNVCQFDFKATYGDIGNGFIHVHHIVPLYNIKESYVVDPVKDLIPVCPNCHAMLHRKNEVMVVDALKKLINTRK